jgi:MbtH protein
VSTNPFDDEEGTFYVLRNGEEQHSLWPAFVDVPEGWQIVFGESTRADCLAFVEENWADIRPKSLRDAMAADR